MSGNNPDMVRMALQQNASPAPQVPQQQQQNASAMSVKLQSFMTNQYNQYMQNFVGMGNNPGQGMPQPFMLNNQYMQNPVGMGNNPDQGMPQPFMLNNHMQNPVGMGNNPGQGMPQPFMLNNQYMQNPVGMDNTYLGRDPYGYYEIPIPNAYNTVSCPMSSSPSTPQIVNGSKPHGQGQYQTQLMAGAQPPSGFPLQTPSSDLNAAAPPFVPTAPFVTIEGNATSHQRASPFQSQMGTMPTPPMGMQQSQPEPAAQKPKQKRNTRRSLTAKPDNAAPKRRNKPVNGTFMQKANDSAIASMPSKMTNRLGVIAHGGTLPRDVAKDMDMTPRPQPRHQAIDFLSNPEQYPITPHTSPTGTPEQPAIDSLSNPEQDLIALHTSPTGTPEQPAIDFLSNPEQDPIAPHTSQTGPTTSEQLIQHRPAPPKSSPTVQNAHQPPLTKNEKYLRQAERDSITPHPSKRRVVRVEQDDPRLKYDQDGKPITPSSDKYSSGSFRTSSSLPTPDNPVYYVPTSDKNGREVDNALIERCLKELQDEKAAVNQDNNSSTILAMPTGQVTTVSERCKPTTADAFKAGATDAFTIPGPPSEVGDAVPVTAEEQSNEEFRPMAEMLEEYLNEDRCSGSASLFDKPTSGMEDPSDLVEAPIDPAADPSNMAGLGDHFGELDDFLKWGENMPSFEPEPGPLDVAFPNWDEPFRIG